MTYGPARALPGDQIRITTNPDTEPFWQAALPGTATVFSYAICNKNPKNGEDYVYVPVVVDLDGAPGTRLNANVSGCDAEDVHIGMKVAVDWTPIQDDWVLPNFKKA